MTWRRPSGVGLPGADGYAESLPATVSWLVETARGGTGATRTPSFSKSMARRRSTTPPKMLDSADIGTTITVRGDYQLIGL